MSHLLIAFLSIFICVCNGETKQQRVMAGTSYVDHDPVHIVVNKVGPFNNPSETYRYYSLPFCKTHATAEQVDNFKKALLNSGTIEDDEKVEEILTSIDGGPQAFGNRPGGQKHHQRLGERMIGDRRETSPYEITFKDDINWRLLCDEELQPEEISQFKDAIHNNYFFEMYIEDLPFWGFLGYNDDNMILGETSDSNTYLFVHLHFRIGYNEDKIVSVEAQADEKYQVDITEVDVPQNFQFSYSVEWQRESEIEWKDRMKKYDASQFMQSNFKVHWLSIVNSVVLVLLLTAFLLIILLRVLRNDFVNELQFDDEDIVQEESGWKLIHGDVFRFPQFISLFSSCIGTGLQLMTLSFMLFALALSGVVSTTRRGSILAACVILYCLTSFVGGYWSTRFYLQLNGKMWVRNILITAGLFPFPLFCIFAWSNTVAIMHGSTSALPIGTIITVLCLYAFLSFPFTVVGGIVAKNYAPLKFTQPTRTTKVAREIPTEVEWYKGRVMQTLISAFLPFSAIYIEMNYIFASMWGHQIYTLFGILMLVLTLLIIVTSFISVALLYFQLAREDHRWWWVAFFNGGASGISIYVYSFIFFFHRSEMNGWLQGSFFFGYMAVVSYAFFLILGSCAFLTCLAFVRYIYSRIKCD